jgi:type II secretory pathway predicted ATPase ExeA
MLLSYFGFSEDPFGATPDPRCLYHSNTHREALASLEYGYYSNRGFTALIAHPGMGKTTLLFRFLDDIRDSARSVFLFDVDTECEPRELVGYILRDMGVTPGRTGGEMHDQLKAILIEEARAGRRFVVVIDEAQNLSDAALEMVRLLTNFETTKSKLMQIVLAGQPQLFDKLAQPNLVQLRQRIAIFCRLEPFSTEDTSAYIDHRLKLAGYRGTPLFTKDAVQLITEASLGIPRTINNLCFNALSLSRAMNCRQVDRRMVTEVISDLQFTPIADEIPLTLNESVREEPQEPKRRERPAWLTRVWAPALATLFVVSVLCVIALSELRPAGPPNSGADLSMDPNVSSTQFPGSATANPSDSISHGPALHRAPFEVVVGPNQTLRDIAVQYLGGFDLERLHQIQTLNPKLVDPNHVEAGEKIWLPAPSSTPGLKDTTPVVNAENVTAASLYSQAASTHFKPTVADSAAKPVPFEVTVGSNKTLRDISIQYLGEFDLGRLHQILALNPELADPDHIQEGQKIWLPGPPLAAVTKNMAPPATDRNLP